MNLPLHEEFRGWKLIEYLGVLWPDRSQSALIGLFARGSIRSGGRPVGIDVLVGTLQDLELAGPLDDIPAILPDEGSGLAAPGEGPSILHEDDRIAVIGKPSGVPVVPDRRGGTESVLGFLTRRELAARASKAPAAYVRPRIVHRIDRLTSGLVIVAKTPEAERKLGADFEGRRVEKEYLAILAGVVAPVRFAVNCPVVPGRKGKMRAEPIEGEEDGWGSGRGVTDFEVVERFARHTLVRAFPRTGRRHQIRVHAWAAAHPLAIDPVYGKPPPAGGTLPGIERLTLHAFRLRLPEDWPEPRTFECPPPEDFRAALDRLRLL